MKFKVKTLDFQKAINAVEGVITVREIKSALSNIKIEAEKEKVFLSATDLEISIKTSLSAETQNTGSGAIPAKQLSNTFKAINFPDVLIESYHDVETGVRTIITDASNKVDFKMNINGIESEETRTVPKVDEALVNIFPCATLAEMIRKTSYSVALEDTRFVFNGLFVISNENKITMVGTDGRRLAKIERSVPNKLPFHKGVIIPHKAIREILKMIEPSETGKIGLVDGQIYTAAGEVELLCKLIEGNYPDYESVIKSTPEDSRNKIRVPKDSLLISLRQALIAAEEPSRQIRLRFSNGNLNVNASTPGSSEVNINIPIEFTGEETVIAFKGDYLLDAVKAIEDSEIIVEFTHTNSPVFMKDPSDPQYISVIMPMKL